MGNKASSSSSKSGAGAGAGNKVKYKKPAKKALKHRLETAQKLGTLQLSCCGYKALPAGVASLKSLRVLDVSTNKLDKFPEEILGLVKLTQLKISGNRLEEMPSLTVLVRLKSLDVSGNALATLPAIPASLRTLVASDNRLAEFPRHVLTPALDTLDLAGNAIHALCDEDLAGADGAASADAPLALTTLHLDDNGLSELPSSWAPVARLAVLTLRRNDLQYVQLVESLFTATELWNLRVEGNSRGQWTQSLLQELPGFADFEARRLRKANKAMHGGVDVDRTLCGLSG